MASFNVKRFLKNPIKGLENAGRSAGKVMRQTAPAVGLIPGVGPGLGAAWGGVGSLAEGRNMKGHATAAATGALSGLANQKLLGGKGVKGVIPAVRRVLGGGNPVSKVPGSGAGNEGGYDPSVLSPDMIAKLGGDGFGMDDIFDFIKGNAVDIGLGGLAAWQMKNAGDASKRAGDLQERGIKGAEERWAQGAPLREAGQRRMLNPTRPDLSSVYSDPYNPLARPLHPALGAPAAPAPTDTGIPLPRRRPMPVLKAAY